MTARESADLPMKRRGSGRAVADAFSLVGSLQQSRLHADAEERLHTFPFFFTNKMTISPITTPLLNYKHLTSFDILKLVFLGEKYEHN